MRRLVLTLSATLSAALLSGCPDAAHDQPVDRTAMVPANEQDSDVPWNKQEGWEQRGQLGPLANDPRVGGGQTH